MTGKKLTPQFLAYRILIWPVVLVLLAACGDSITATPVAPAATPTIAFTSTPVSTSSPTTGLATTSATTVSNPVTTAPAATSNPVTTLAATTTVPASTPAATTSNPTIAPTTQGTPAAGDLADFINYSNPQANLPGATDTALLQSFMDKSLQIPWSGKLYKFIVTTDSDATILKYYKDAFGQKSWDTYRNIERVGNYGVFGKGTRKLVLSIESAARTNSSIKTGLPAGSNLIIVIAGDDLFPAPTTTIQDIPAYPGAQIPTLSSQDKEKNNLRDDTKVFLTNDSVNKVIGYYRNQMLSKGYLVMAIESCSTAPDTNGTAVPEVADCSVAFSYFPGKEIQMKVGRTAISGLPAGTNAIVYGLENNDY